MNTFSSSCPLLVPANSSLPELPAPSSLSLMWNVGSLLSITLALQLGTGLFLAIHYSPWTATAFTSISEITRENFIAWAIRATHANGASLYFVLIYAHIARGLYYGSYRKQNTWNLGVVIFILSIATAFVGYVLVWGQISFWGATVITNLLSAIPYAGPFIVEWIWGGFAVENATLNRFFVLHFLIPFIIAGAVLFHLILLHTTGSSNPLGTKIDTQNINFHPYFSENDIIGFGAFLIFIFTFSIIYPNLFSDPENFIPANEINTPEHINPEWYFLWAYAILRSIPNNLGGVIVIFAAILILLYIPILWRFNNVGLSVYPLSQSLFWALTITILLLTWIGGCPVEDPYISLGQLFTVSLFLLYWLIPNSAQWWDQNIHKVQ